MRPFAKHLLRRFELYLAVGAAVFVGVVYLLFRWEADTGFTVAVTVIGMGLVQGAIQWADRERSKRLRARQIHEIREMMRDQVLNRLASMKVWLAERPDPETAARAFEEIGESVDEIATLIDQLSEQQLNTWKLTYANAANHIEMPEAPLDAMPTVDVSIPGAPLRPAAQTDGEAMIVRAQPTVAAPAAAPKADAPSVALWN